VAVALAEAGADIGLCDIDADGLAETEKNVRALGRRVLAMETEVCDATVVARFHEAAGRSSSGSISSQPGGGVKQRDFLTSTEEEDAADIRRNFGYVIQPVRPALPPMRRGGSIINLTTI
jgi:NAD(P)-dependent dehydrogenase (short-subunit alcohol dehydrogenase family)